MAATGADASHRSLRASLARQVVSVHRIRRVGVVNRSHVHRMDADGSPRLGLVWFGFVWMQHVTTRWSTRLGRNSKVCVTTISVLSPQLDLDARATLLCGSVLSLHPNLSRFGSSLSIPLGACCTCFPLASMHHPYLRTISAFHCCKRTACSQSNLHRHLLSLPLFAYSPSALSFFACFHSAFMSSPPLLLPSSYAPFSIPISTTISTTPHHHLCYF